MDEKDEIIISLLKSKMKSIADRNRRSRLVQLELEDMSYRIISKISAIQDKIYEHNKNDN